MTLFKLDEASLQIILNLILAKSTCGTLLYEKRSAGSGSGLHVLSPMSRSLGQLGEALSIVRMPLILPPHGMMLMQLVLDCTC